MNGQDAADLSLAKPLTAREQDVLNCMGQEMSNRQIAEQLTLAHSTVKWYVRQIFNKLGVSERRAAMARAQQLGYLPTGDRAERTRHNLPVAATPFVGRAHELAALLDLIRDSQVRLITLVGPGGIGKTRLALEAAERALEHPSQFPDGIFFVSLAPIQEAAEMVTTLAADLNFHFQEIEPGGLSEKDQVLHYLRQKQMLLIFDNFEHLLDGREFIVEISRQAAGVKILVTSRERLQLHGEHLFPLQGLDYPAQEDQILSGQANYQAAELFMACASRIIPHFELIEGDAEQLWRICRLVEGMPLGLELAASWVSILPLSKIAGELEHSLDLLAAEHSDVPQRHQSMTAALELSWRRLTADQQRAFQELTVFHDGFTREAAVAVAGASLPLLVTLANKSWLFYDRQKDRYFIHTLLRQYGAGILKTDPDHENDVQARHSSFFCHYLQERASDWHGPRQLEAAKQVRSEIDNVQRAWRWAATQGDSHLLAQGLNSLCTFYNREGRLMDALNACRLAAEGMASAVDQQCTQDVNCLVVWSQVLAWESNFVLDVARKEDLLAQSQQRLDQAAQTGRDTQAEQAHLLLFKSYAASQTDLEEAKRLANLGLEIFQLLGDKIGEAQALKMVGTSHLFQGNIDLADDDLQDSLRISRQLGDTQGIAETLTYLGMAARQRGDFEAAETLIRQGVELYRQIENRYNEEFNLASLSIILIQSGKFPAAREAMAQAIKITGDLGILPDSLYPTPLATAELHLGNYTDAQAIAAESLERARQKGDLLQAGWSLECLGEISFVIGELEGAVQYLRESAAVLKELGHVYQSLAQAVLGYVYRASGKVEQAHPSLLSALRLGTRAHSILPIIMSLPVAALLAADDGRPERAVELYSLAQQFGHIRNSRWYEAVAGRELEGVRAALPAAVASAAEDRGQELDVWETASQLVAELTGKA